MLRASSDSAADGFLYPPSPRGHGSSGAEAPSPDIVELLSVKLQSLETHLTEMSVENEELRSRLQQQQQQQSAAIAEVAAGAGTDTGPAGAGAGDTVQPLGSAQPPLSEPQLQLALERTEQALRNKRAQIALLGGRVEALEARCAAERQERERGAAQLAEATAELGALRRAHATARRELSRAALEARAHDGLEAQAARADAARRNAEARLAQALELQLVDRHMSTDPKTGEVAVGHDAAVAAREQVSMRIKAQMDAHEAVVLREQAEALLAAERAKVRAAEGRAEASAGEAARAAAAAAQGAQELERGGREQRRLRAQLRM